MKKKIQPGRSTATETSNKTSKARRGRSLRCGELERREKKRRDERETEEKTRERERRMTEREERR